MRLGRIVTALSSATFSLQIASYRTLAAHMARGRKGKGRRGGDRDRDGGHRPYQSHPTLIRENAKLQEYYDTLLQLPEEERAEFWAALRRDLPNSFRFCGSKGHALAVKRLLQTRYIPEITRIQYEGQNVDPPKPVPWYPDELAWWMTTPKNVVRKFPPFAAFQRFLVSETSVGNISRQEVVSMIPPLLMDVKPGMTVLDMCAAPGSKAAQLLEMIHRGEEARIRKVMKSFQGEPIPSDEEEDDPAARLSADPGDDGRATGLLIANDADYKRSHMLIHQLKRLSSPNMIVTNHDATMYPSLRIPNPTNPDKPAYLKFDRILADVPCSGDGTLRKNINLWKDWTPGNALGLHLTQVRILVRALQMLKPGGRVVYSTCSMNPVENEAVVAAAIERCGGPDKIEIIDCSEELPLLRRRPGMRQWKVMDKSGRLWSSWDEVEEYTRSQPDGIAPGRLVESMFPRPETSDCKDLPLERCMRVYAHLQDTGGFFITALRKKAEFKAKPEEPRRVQPTQARAMAKAAAAGEKRPLEGEEGGQEVKKVRLSEEPVKAEEEAAAVETPVEAAVETPAEAVETPVEPVPEAEVKPGAEAPTNGEAAQTSQSAQPEPKQRKPDGPYEEPFKYLPPTHDVIQSVATFYSISPRFPLDRFMVRNALGEPAKAIYYTSSLVRDILTLNEGRGVKFVHGGVKMFVKQEAPSAEVCRWRIQSEGMPILHGYVGAERVVVLRKKETLRKLLVEMFPKIGGDEWRRMDEIGERVRDLGLGCCVLRVEPDPDQGEDFGAEEMALPLWKSFQSLNLMLPKEDRSAMLLRIFNDTTPLVNMGIKREKKEEGAAEEGKVDEEMKDAVEQEAEADAAESVKGEEEGVGVAGDVEVPDAPAEGEQKPAEATGSA